MKPLARAAIVAVGSELLTPARLDTNSLFITEQLNLLAIDVVAKAVVGDDRAELAHVFRSLLARVDLVVFSGGLGPTDDDVTRDAVAGVLERPLREDPAITAALPRTTGARRTGPTGPACSRTPAAARPACGWTWATRWCSCCRDRRAS
jgi:nicotinamide-nucleotide amidase